MKNPAAVAVVLLMVLQPASAQTADSGALLPRRLLVSIAYPQGYELSAELEARISRSLLVALARAEGIRIFEYTGEARETQKQWEAEAVKSGADCWLSIIFQGGPDTPSITLLSYDTALGKKRIDATIPLPSPLSESGISDDMWEDAVSLVAEQYFAVDPAVLERAAKEKAALSFKALPNTRITGLPGGPVDVGKNGTAVVEVPIPGSYSILLTRQCFLPATMDLYVDSPLDVSVVQEPGPLIAVDFTLFNNFFPGVGLVFFPVPDYVFLKLGIDSFLIGLALNDQTAFFSLPLTNVTFQAGSFFTPEESVPRISVAIGAFLRIAHLEGNPFIIDALAPGGGLLALSAEIGPTTRHRFFVEYAAMIYFTDYPDLLRAAVDPEETPEGYAFTGLAVFSLFNLRLGFRWLL
jgi:hypothetical protein